VTNPEGPSLQLRLTILIMVVACLFSALFARLWFLQVINANRAQTVAADNGIRTIYIPAPRGEILDTNGALLVGNVNQPVIEVNRQVVAGNPQVLARLAPLLGISVATLKTDVANTQYSPYAPVPIPVPVTAQQILYIQENQSLFPGVAATTVSERYYTPAGLAAANLVGYVGQIGSSELAQLKNQGYQAGDQIGLTGIEAEYESYLRGKPGVEKVQVDSQGNVLGTLSYTPPVPGDNIELTIDGQIQMAAEAALAQGEAAARATYDTVTHRNFTAPAGAAVVENPQNGDVIALATSPTYPVNEFVGGISEANYQALLNNPTDPLLDRTIQGQYAPGSTFKLITATAGLEYGIITPTSIFDDTGRLQVGTFIAHNDDFSSYGPIDLAQAITVSSDLFFNRIGLDLWYDYTGDQVSPSGSKVGPDALQQVAAAYGLGQPTGIDLPNEAPGKIPTPESYKLDYERYPAAFSVQKGIWYPGNSDQVAIGQDEDLVTPLQLANAYATFANGGTRYAPILVKEAISPDGRVVKVFHAQVKGSVPLQPAWRAAMLAGFEGVTHSPDGTAYGVFDSPEYEQMMDIAGKTGTAQVTGAGRQDTSVFTSFAPAADPQYVVDAFVEDAGYGASVAAPVVRQIYDALYHEPLQPVAFTVASGPGGQN
jgi:penicillin-binding protein 2